MNHRSSYEQMLEAQCANHGKIHSLLDKIAEYDHWLLLEAKKQLPDTSAIEYCNIQKNRIIQQLDALTKEVSKLQYCIEEEAALLLDGMTHPLSIRLSKIQELTSAKFHEVLQAEDQNNPEIFHNLSSLRERLILDAKMQAVPPSQRQIFFVRL